MPGKRAWTAYPENYRAKEVAMLARWIAAGESGSCVGLTGSGKSNLLGFLCNRPEVLDPYLPDSKINVALVHVDLNDLPDNTLGTFYRILLRSLFEARPQLIDLEPGLAAAVETSYRKIEDKTDAFLAQSALREALLWFQDQTMRLVFVLDPFDEFCRTATLQVLDNLRGLRDSFKTVLSYLIGVGDEIAQLRDPMEMGKLYKLLDEHVCWVGAMTEGDAGWVINQVAGAMRRPFSEAEIGRLIQVTGGYPSLLRAASLWLVKTTPPPESSEWVEALLVERTLQHRLDSLWDSMSLDERLVLSEVQKLQTQGIGNDETGVSIDEQQSLDVVFEGLNRQHRSTLERLSAYGLCLRTKAGWRIHSELISSYVAGVEDWGSGKIWLDEATERLYIGQSPFENLAPLEREVLMFLVKNPLVRHTKTDLIVNTWPDELRREGVTDQSLYQVILELRKKIEPNWKKPSYLITWRGKPEGGYQFFPEGGSG